MVLNIRPKSLKTILSVLVVFSVLVISMGAAKNKSAVKKRAQYQTIAFTYLPPVPVPSYAPADVSNSANWSVTYPKCQGGGSDIYPCTFYLTVLEDSASLYTDFLYAYSRLKIETSNTDTAYVTGVKDNLTGAPLDVFIANGSSPYGD